MRRDDAIRLLKQAEPELRARGALGVSLFGSTARDEAGPESDVDVLVELDMARRPTLVDLSGIRLFIGDTLGREVDLAIRDSLRPTYRASIEADAIRIF
jgi:predicted nucleotidyltransferase